MKLNWLAWPASRPAADLGGRPAWPARSAGQTAAGQPPAGQSGQKSMFSGTVRNAKSVKNIVVKRSPSPSTSDLLPQPHLNLDKEEDVSHSISIFSQSPLTKLFEEKNPYFTINADDFDSAISKINRRLHNILLFVCIGS